MSRNIILFCVSSILSLTAIRCIPAVRQDKAMAAVEAMDYTALIEGCGRQLIPGYTYCRVGEGDSTAGTLAFVAPATECLSNESCANFKLYHPSQGLIFGGIVPKGQTRAEISWKQILGRDTFELSDIGFWPYSYEIKWLDPKGDEHTTYSQGEIRMRVIRKKVCDEKNVCKYYEPLHNVEGNDAFVWEWIENEQKVKMTTGARTYVGPKK
jgi:hypothetical protein